MRFRRKGIIKSLVLITVLLIRHVAMAQWGSPYANHWIAYGKPYLKIGITAKGLHKVPFSSLPKNFPIDSPDKLQLWRRGKQVSIISTENNEILFYAVPNDGASDSLLYRPMRSRMNPYFSLYSDEGSFFLTIGESAGSRAKVVNQPVDNKLPQLPFHKEVLTKVFKDQYSLSTARYPRAEFFNSYFELAASSTDSSRAPNILRAYPFKLQNFAKGAQKTSVRLLVHGRSKNDRKIEAYAGKTAGSLRLVNRLPNSGFSGTEYAFNLNPDDLDVDGNGVLALKSVSPDPEDLFSLTYYSIEFPQDFNAEKQAGKEFRLEPTNEKWSKLSIKGMSANAVFLDITDVNNPIVVKGAAENLMVPRQAGISQVLLATSQINEVAGSRIKKVEFQHFIPKEPNYIIITSDSLLEGANQFSQYRASEAGGSFRTIVANIRDIYNQFNNGEPSPVAIKKFMDYMLSEGGKDKYLFLIGKSITYNEKMKRELPDEVPTIGFPGSDALLVEGVAGAPIDMPAIPVGRLTAITNQNVLDYLQKVKDYESNGAQDYGWRKNFLHLNGGKTLGEITQFRELLEALEPTATNGVAGGTVKPYAKKQAMAEAESVDITSDINDGAGLITFFGHGSTTITDLDMGYISDPARGYHNLHRYPMMYFNGCGVGNIFSGRFNPKPQNPKSLDRITLSLDWLLTADKGAIAIIANSFESFVAPASTYLQRLYNYMFADTTTANLSIGKIQLAVANDIISNYKDKYSIANVHQSLLQGDPALKLITVAKPDYALDPDASITLNSQSKDKSIEKSDSIRISVSISNNGRFAKGQSVPIEVTCFGKNWNVVHKETFNAFPSKTTLEASVPNLKYIHKIRVQVDPQHTISELNTSNNIAELDVDWDLIKDKTSFSYENAKDVIAPLIDVRFNDRLLKMDEVIGFKPFITITLSDDRQLFPDTALVEVFIKRCGNDDCEFEKITYSSHDIELDSAGNKALRINYKSDWGKGVYEVLVNARDRAGNATVKPYRIRFIINEQEGALVKLVVSPNPASSYLRFELSSEKQIDLKTVRCLIYNSRGVIVEDKDLPGSLLSLRKEWYWLPTHMPAGLHTYKVVLINSDNMPFETFSGKVIIAR